MGVLDNLKKIRKSYQNRNAVARIARKAVIQGRIESDFLAEYNSFSVALKEVLERTLIIDNNSAITIGASLEKDPESMNVKFLNYVLQDEEYMTLYNMEKDKANNVTFSLKLLDLGDDFKEVSESYDTEFMRDIDYYLQD